MTLNILYIDPTQGTGGATKSLLAFLGALDTANIKSYILQQREGPQNKFFLEKGVIVLPQKIGLMKALMFDPYLGIKCHNICIRQSIKFVGMIVKHFHLCWILFFDYLRIITTVKKNNIHLIHFNSYRHAYLPIALICNLLDIPIIFHVRGRTTPGRWCLLFTRFASFIFVSDFVAKHFLATGAKTKGNYTVYNGRSSNEFGYVLLKKDTEASLKQSLAIPQNHKLIINVGTLSRGKGQHTYIMAANIVCREKSAVTFLIVGDNVPYEDDIRSELSKLVTEHNLREKVLFLGQRSDIPELMAQSDISVVSTELPEALCGVNIETMATKTPLVTTDTGSVHEVVIHNETGLLVPAGDHKAMARAILYLLSNEEEAEKMAMRGHARFLEKFNTILTTAQLVKIYEKLLSIKISVE